MNLTKFVVEIPYEKATKIMVMCIKNGGKIHEFANFIDIRNDTPNDGERVYYYNDDKEIRIGRWFEDENSIWEIDIGVGIHDIVTHWKRIEDI